jgi:hypothetical protein
MIRKTVLAGCVVILCLVTAIGRAQQPALPSDQETEQMDMAMRRFGYVSGQALQCHAKEQQIKIERGVLDIAKSLQRLYGSDRAFYYAAAFGAGSSERISQKQCPALIKEAETMFRQMKVLATR